MCRLLGLKVYEVKWWGFTEAHVIYRKTDRVYKTVLLTLAPFLISNLVAFGIMLLIAASYSDPLEPLLFFWLAASLAFHSFPSIQDARNSFSHMSKSFSSMFSRHKKEFRKDRKAVLKLAGDAALFLFVELPIMALLGFMILMGFFLIAILGWIYVLQMFAYTLV